MFQVLPAGKDLQQKRKPGFVGKEPPPLCKELEGEAGASDSKKAFCESWVMMFHRGLAPRWSLLHCLCSLSQPGSWRL